MPKHTLPFSKISSKDVLKAGGKGASLGEMARAKISVPPGFVVLAQSYQDFVKANNLEMEILSQLKNVNPDDTNSVDRASNVIRDVIHDTPMPKDLEKELLAEFTRLKSPYVAVRSSATAEDSDVASWAGELDTFLYVTKDKLLDAVKECWMSLFTPRAIVYRFEKNLHDADVHVAVVVQKMVNSEIAGVCFTVHPVTKDPNQMVIEAAYGLGEALVSGMVTPDTYVVDKEDDLLLDVNIGEQQQMILQNTKAKGVQKTITKAVPVAERANSRAISNGRAKKENSTSSSPARSRR
ncbi:MAG: hypothetical protein HYV34_00540 [Candidatus Kerfeldbacteria bacterium]|nr:hypothetical protein [Candidatus Kerfeldbacteria bacterium]